VSALDIPSRAALVPVFIYFNLITNVILLPALVFTFLFVPKVRAKRHPTLVNMCIAWVFSGVFACLLLVPIFLEVEGD